MRVAVVGNGGSANFQAAAIDSCDYVVRMKRWITRGPVFAGKKVSALAGFNAEVEIPPKLLHEPHWDLWVTIPAEWATDPSGALDYDWVKTYMKGRSVYFASMSLTQKVVSYFKRNTRKPYISMGLACLAMAISRGYEEINLWGYDKTGFGSAKDDWAQEACNDTGSCPHDWAREKTMIQEAVDGLWLGEKTGSKIIWHKGVHNV